MAKAENIYLNTIKMHKTIETELNIKQLSEILFLVIKIFTGFNTDDDTICAVSLANHLRAVADTFCPFRTHQLY